MQIVLVRHTSVDVPKEMCYGQTDVPLRSSFQNEAQITEQKLRQFGPFDCIYSSPLSRCVRLAEYCGFLHPKLDDRLMEINFGAWEMVPFDENPDPRLLEWYDDYLHVRATEGESLMDQYERVSAFMAELLNRSYKNVLIFAHGGTLLCIGVYLKLYTFDTAFSHQLPYGGVEVVQA